MPIVSIKDAPNLKGVHVLVRSALNVPVENGVVTNPFRLTKALPTIEWLQHQGAKVILLSHIDGPVGSSLEPVYKELKKKIGLTFVHDIGGTATRAALTAMKDGDVVLLENVRREAGEIGNDDAFARKLATLADVYVNDDFPTTHRRHASIVGVPKYLPSYAGLQFMSELIGLTPALNPQSPSLAIIGGAKFVTKEPLIRKLLTLYDKVFLGGALANDFFKAEGYEVGRSLVSDASQVKDLLHNSKIIVPVDVTVEGVDGKEVKKPDEVLENEIIYDMGPESLALLAPLIQKARIVVWNGPLGNFEKGYTEMTEGMAREVALASGVSVVGGGDTVASIQKLGLNDKFEYLSTAGGAMLDFLANGTLPGIEALAASKQLG